MRPADVWSLGQVGAFVPGSRASPPGGARWISRSWRGGADAVGSTMRCTDRVPRERDVRAAMAEDKSYRGIAKAAAVGGRVEST